MLVDIDKIKVTDRIRKDFGNLDELAEDIKENGLINPPVVTPDLQLIAGERRLRACQRLGWKQIEVRVMTVRDAEHQLKLEINENENRKDFTFTEKMEWARRLERIEKAKAEERMKTGKELNPSQNSDKGRTDEIVAKESGFGSRDTYRKAKFIAENGDEELISKLDAGEISIHKAYTEIKERLKQEEEARKRAEQQVQKLREQMEYAKGKVEVKEVVKEVVPPEIKRKLEEAQRRVAELERQLKEQENDIKRVEKIREEIERLSLQRDDLRRQIDSSLELSALYVEIENLLKTKLAPIKYSRALTERRDSEVVMENLRGIIAMVEEWCYEMKSYLPKGKYIEAEVVEL